MKAVILAAGSGSRLGELRQYTSKATLPVLGKALATRVFESLADLVDGFVVVANPEDEQTRMLLSASPWSQAEVRVVYQPVPLGSADALRFAANHVQGACLVTACDNLMRRDFLANLIAEFQRGDAEAMLAVGRIDEGHQPPSSTIAMDDRGQVLKIVEKPEPTQMLSHLTAYPLYVLQESFFDVLVQLKPSARGEYEVPGAIQLLIDRGGVVRGTIAHERVTVNSPGEYLEAVRVLLASNASECRHGAKVAEQAQMQTPYYLEPGSVVHPGAVVGPYVYVLSGAVIGEGAELRDSIIFHDAVVSAGSTVRSSIVLPSAVIDLQRSRDTRDPTHHR